MNNLKCVPEFNNKTVKIIRNIEVHVNDVHRGSTKNPFDRRILCTVSREVNKKIINHFIQYIGDHTVRSPHGSGKYVLESPCIIFRKIISLCNIKGVKDLTLFYSRQNYTFCPSLIPSTYESLNYIIHFYELREEIVPFLRQTLGEIPELKNLIDWFDAQGNCKSFDEYIDKKINQLISIDLDYYLEGINSEQESKINKYRVRGRW